MRPQSDTRHQWIFVVPQTLLLAIVAHNEERKVLRPTVHLVLLQHQVNYLRRGYQRWHPYWHLRTVRRRKERRLPIVVVAIDGAPSFQLGAGTKKIKTVWISIMIWNQISSNLPAIATAPLDGGSPGARRSPQHYAIFSDMQTSRTRFISSCTTSSLAGCV